MQLFLRLVLLIQQKQRIIAVLGDKKAEFVVPFKLTKKQKDKIIDAVAEKLLSIEEK